MNNLNYVDPTSMGTPTPSPSPSGGGGSNYGWVIPVLIIGAFVGWGIYVYISNKKKREDQ